jgi:microcystin-dependent protein
MSKARDLASVASRSADTKPGTIAHFASATAPDGWLPCDGGSYSAALYPALFAILGTVGQSAFNVPDLRGEFIRGVDNGRGVDPGRTLRSSQGQQFQDHEHEVGSTAVYFAGTPTVSSGTSQQAQGMNRATGFALSGNRGTETRPRNVALLACIKF